VWGPRQSVGLASWLAGGEGGPACSSAASLTCLLGLRSSCIPEARQDSWWLADACLLNILAQPCPSLPLPPAEAVEDMLAELLPHRVTEYLYELSSEPASQWGSQPRGGQSAGVQ
jgi:hypothetical protein